MKNFQQQISTFLLTPSAIKTPRRVCLVSWRRTADLDVKESPSSTTLCSLKIKIKIKLRYDKGCHSPRIPQFDCAFQSTSNVRGNKPTWLQSEGRLWSVVCHTLVGGPEIDNEFLRNQGHYQSLDKIAIQTTICPAPAVPMLPGSCVFSIVLGVRPCQKAKFPSFLNPQPLHSFESSINFQSYKKNFFFKF